MTTNSLVNSWIRVRRLAQRYASDFEGHDLTGEMPLRVYAGERSAGRVLVTTNDPVVRRWGRAARPRDLAVVVTAGILTSGQAALIARLSSRNAGPIPFVGDADPMSLHAFISLRAYLGARNVRFCGICDEMLDGLGDERARPDSIESLELSAFDQAHLRILAGLADLDEVLGPRVSAVLAGGRKIELEALSFRADVIPAFLGLALRVGVRRPPRRRRMSHHTG
jgi:hypothetical protein